LPALNNIFNEIEELELDDQEKLLGVLEKRVRDHKREQLAHRAKEAINNANSGKSKAGTFEDLWTDLND
jgi:hypothetical protein